MQRFRIPAPGLVKKSTTYLVGAAAHCSPLWAPVECPRRSLSGSAVVRKVSFPSAALWTPSTQKREDGPGGNSGKEQTFPQVSKFQVVIGVVALSTLWYCVIQSIWSYQKTSDPTVQSLLFFLRTHPHLVKELGKGFDILKVGCSAVLTWPDAGDVESWAGMRWTKGEVKALRGIMNVEFYAKGDKNIPVKVTAKARKTTIPFKWRIEDVSLRSLLDNSQWRLFESTQMLDTLWEPVTVGGYVAREDDLHDGLVLVKQV